MYNLDETWKHAEWQKPVTKKHTFHIHEMSGTGKSKGSSRADSNRGTEH